MKYLLGKLHPIMITSTLRICTWNIHGYYSRTIGNKFEDKEFIKTFNDVDIIGITETHSHEEVNNEITIPGFHRLKTKNELKNKRSNTAPKGIAVRLLRVELSYVHFWSHAKPVFCRF